MKRHLDGDGDAPDKKHKKTKKETNAANNKIDITNYKHRYIGNGPGYAEIHRIVLTKDGETVTTSAPFHTPGHAWLGTRQRFLEEFQLVL